MKPEFIAYGIYAYMMVGFLLWLWALVDDEITGNRCKHGIATMVLTLVAMLLGWPFLVGDLVKPRGRK